MANPGHVDLVRDRTEHWNDWRRKNTRVQPDLAGADLTEFNLAGANLAKADLSGARLEGANLSGANLSRAKLFRADLSQADLSRASLFKANLSQADLGCANLNGADLSGALLIRSNLSGASLAGACLKGANFGQASLFRAMLVKAVLREASFFKSDLTEADLSEADLEGANFQEAVLEQTNLRAAKAAGANLCFATLLRTNLEGAVLDHCAVYGISLWDANLSGSSQLDRFHSSGTAVEQLGWKAPDAVILPVGNGTLLLGAHIGFRELMQAGITGHMPKIIGVQSVDCAPLSRAFHEGAQMIPSVQKKETLAEGIAIADPIRGKQILEAQLSSAEGASADRTPVEKADQPAGTNASTDAGESSENEEE